MKVAIVATLAALPVAIGFAYLLARTRFPGKTLLDAVLHLPLVLPPVVTGYVLLLLFGRKGPAGAWLYEHLGIVFSFRWTGAALAAAGIAHDRVTLYRTLDWLVTHGLAHRVAGSDRIWRFNATVEEGRSHAHFQCARCGAVFCLETTSPTLAATLPPGFRFERAELTVYGVCPNC